MAGGLSATRDPTARRANPPGPTRGPDPPGAQIGGPSPPVLAPTEASRERACRFPETAWRSLGIF
ncbi:hypothetical protein IBTHAUMO2_220003 [Nitrosopumilaceae archaeon]|nr:hypothetical protein IBTHAUMO2_220003 [Nitrosopumilaceae archaeon]